MLCLYYVGVMFVLCRCYVCIMLVLCLYYVGVMFVLCRCYACIITLYDHYDVQYHLYEIKVTLICCIAV